MRTHWLSKRTTRAGSAEPGSTTVISIISGWCAKDDEVVDGDAGVVVVEANMAMACKSGESRQGCQQAQNGTIGKKKRSIL